MIPASRSNVNYEYQYFKKIKETFKSRGANVCLLPYFPISTSYFVIY